MDRELQLAAGSTRILLESPDMHWRPRTMTTPNSTDINSSRNTRFRAAEILACLHRYLGCS